MNERECSSQSDQQSFSAPSNDDSYWFDEDMFGKDSWMNKNEQENIS